MKALIHQVSPMIALESIAQKILLIRGKKVMLDADLAELYGVQPRCSIKRYGETSGVFRLISCSN